MSPLDIQIEPNKHAFGVILTALHAGHRVCRAEWNGKGMYLYLVPENRYAPTTPAGEEIASTQADGKVPYGAYIAMKTAQNNVVPWLASQTDVLATDWVILPDIEAAPEYDAELRSWSCDYYEAQDAYILRGRIHGDRKDRFRDGEMIRTSAIDLSKGSIAPGRIVHTRNSRYLLA